MVSTLFMALRISEQGRGVKVRFFANFLWHVDCIARMGFGRIIKQET